MNYWQELEITGGTVGSMRKGGVTWREDEVPSGRVE
jgi:hypothetical protein